MMSISFYITLLLLSLNQVVSISKSGGVNFYLFDIAVGFFALFGLVYFLLVKKSFKIPKYSVLFVIFSLIAGISLILALPNLSSIEATVSSFYLFRFASYLLATLVVFNMVDKEIITKAEIYKAFIYSGLFIAIVGFIQLMVLPDFTTLNPELGWDPHKNRLASTFFDPNFVGAYFVLCLTLLLEKFYPQKKSGNTKSERTTKIDKKDLFIFLILIIGLVLTFSRSAWGMFGVVVLMYGIFRSRALLIGAIFVVFMTYFAVPRVQTRISGITDPADSASLRIVSWNNTVKIIKDHFWTGVGFNVYRYVQEDYGFLTPDNSNINSGAGSDSSFLFVFATTGIFGFIIYTFAILFPIVDSVFKRTGEWLVIFTVLIGFLLESQFLNSLFYPQIMFFLFCIMFSYPSHT